MTSPNPGDYVQLPLTGEIARVEHRSGAHVTLRRVLHLPDDDSAVPLEHATFTAPAAELRLVHAAADVRRAARVRPAPGDLN